MEGRDQRSYLGKLRYLILIAYIKAVSPLLLQLSFSIASKLLKYAKNIKVFQSKPKLWFLSDKDTETSNKITPYFPEWSEVSDDDKDL